jgi:lysophospholipase L1-like esterase
LKLPFSAVFVRAMTAAAVLVMGCGLIVHSPATAAAPPKVNFVALGDSYASGVGAGTESGTCRVTDGAYPALWSRSGSNAVTLTQKACSGADTADVLAEQTDALSAGTDLVSITVGSNDLDLTGALRICADPSQAQNCAAKLAAAKQALATTFPAALAKTLTAVHEAAPEARLAVVGYPVPFENVANCALPLPETLREAGNTAVTGINQVLAAQAAAIGATFVDVTGRYAGHGLCSTAPWIVGLEGVANETLLHPTKEGQTEGYLAEFTARIGTPESIQAWIAHRDKPSPSPGVSSPASPQPEQTASPGVTPSQAAGGTGGNAPMLAVTGTNVWWVAGVGLALLLAGTVAYRSTRPRRARVGSE